MPEPAKGEPVAPPAFQVKDGRVFIDGVDVTEVARPGLDDTPDEPPKAANEDNAALEGDEVEVPKKEEAKPEVKPESEKAEVKPEEKPPEPKEPEKLKFKLKFRGKEEEVEYEPTQIQVRLNKLRAFEENEKEFWEKGKEVEPYHEIVKSEWFKTKLQEAYESGELAAPKEPESPPPTVQYEIMRRKADPDLDTVMEALRDYARNLPVDAVKILDSDPNVFLAEYDRVAKDVREKKTTTPPPPPKVEPEDLKKKLALKESAKSRAEVVTPGTMTEPQSATVAWQKKERELTRAMRDPAQVGRHMEIVAELLMHRQQKPAT